MRRFLPFSLPSRYTLSRLFVALMLIMVGYFQTANTAFAATVWGSPASLSTTNSLQGIRYGGGEWLAMGISNTIATSTDGKNWSVYYPENGFNDWSDAVFDGSKWVMVGSNGKIFTSTGNSASTTSGWSPQTSDVSSSLWGIAYGGNTYVAVGDGGTVLTSGNGTTWSKNIVLGEEGNSFLNVMFANNMFIAVSDSRKIYTSGDGMNWTPQFTSTVPLYGIGYGNSKYVAVGAGEVAISTNGTSWTSSDLSDTYYSIDYGNGKYVAAGAGGKLLTSTDGSSWSNVENANTSTDLFAVRYSAEQGGFVTVGGNSNTAIIRSQSINSNLSNLTVSAGSLSPAFASGTLGYTATVGSEITSVTVTPTAKDSDAKIEVRVNGGTYSTIASGQASGSLSLNYGTNTVDVHVTAQDGTTNKTYTITVTRAEPNAPPTDITLSNNKIAENMALGTVIGTLNAVDPTPGETFTFSLVGGDTGSFTIVGNELESNAVFDYETKNSYSVTILVTDSGHATFSKVFTIEVTNVNEAPTVSNSTQNGTEDNDVIFNLDDYTSNYHDNENDSLNKIQIVSLPAHGTLKLNNTPVTLNQEIMATDIDHLKFTPDSNWNGNTSFTWKGHDGSFYSTNTATLTLAIAAVDDLPTVTSSEKTGPEDTDMTFGAGDFTSHYSDVDGESLVQIQVLTVPDSGKLTLDGATPSEVAVNQVIPVADLSKLRFTPAANWHGTTSFTWKGFDGHNYSNEAATLRLTITAVNDPPTVSNSSKDGREDEIITFTAVDFTSHYTDEEGDHLTKIKMMSLPTNGTLKLKGQSVSIGEEILAEDLPKLSFSPDANWSGTTFFTWKGFDGADYSANEATLTLKIASVYDPPTVNNSSKNGKEDTEATFAETDFSAHFTDVEGGSLSKIRIVSLPTNGTLMLKGTKVAVNNEIDAIDLSNLSFIPDQNWNGTTSFEWKGSDGTEYSTESATLSLVIEAVNDLPTVKTSTMNGTEDTDVVFTISDFESNFADVDGDKLNKIQIASLPTNGTLQFEGNAISNGQEIPAADLGKLRFHPNQNWSGSTSFKWKGHDGTEYSADTATMTLTISGVNDEPTISSIGNQTIREDEQSPAYPFTIGDEETAADELVVTASSSNQTLVPNSNLSLQGTGANRSISIKPAANQNGVTTITITVSDGTNRVSQSFVLTVDPVNDPPLAKDGTLTVTQNQAKKGTLQATDVDNDALIYSLVSLPTKGTVTIDASTGAFTYTPNPSVTGQDSFTFKVHDGTEDSNTATIAITISSVYVPQPTNQAPTISSIPNQTINADEKTPVIPFVVNDPDTDVRSLTVTASSSNQELVPDAKITLGGSGANRTVQVVPEPNKNGSATITLIVSDGQLSARSTFIVTVGSVNHPPVANNDILLVKDDKTTKGMLTASDVDKDPLTYILVGKPKKGTVTITDAKTGAYTYKPTKGKSGDDSFTFKANDGALDSNVATVIVTHSAVSNADLRALTVSSGTLDPEFAANRTIYNVHVADNIKEITITAVTMLSSSTVKINGKAVASGQASDSIKLKAGQNEVKIVVRAQDGTEKSYKVTVERESIQITEIKLDQSSVTLTEGGKPVILTATVQPEEAREIQLVWTSSKPSVATVDEQGQVVPLTEGTTVITVSSPDGKVKDTCSVKVQAGENLELIADPSMLVMSPNDTESVRIRAYLGNESKRDITSKVIWTSEDQKVATVSKGKVRAKAAGTTRIVAKYKGKKVSILVKVYDPRMVDDRDVSVSFTPTGDQNSSKLTVTGKLLTKNNVTVQVVVGNKTYSSKVANDKKTFSFERTLEWIEDMPKELQLIVKSKASKKEKQIITLPLLLLDTASIKLDKNPDGSDQDSYIINGQIFNQLYVKKVEAVGEDGTNYLGLITEDQFEIPLQNFTGNKVIVRAESYTGMTQEWEVEVER
ncbi:tandem-95 repeat protein [Brevibacillus ginsengisoli]|uniref:tandem-95 repeat protein n=1 Tax=Brevibacillus ginsengisoli TaxID=363854 RepID=UPI003CE739BB